MKGQVIHIVSFDIPYPANYGGVIDVFYKIRALHREGAIIHLHCFHDRRSPQPELEKYCRSVTYYPRQTGWSSQAGLDPYIVRSRRSGSLPENLSAGHAPIIFEGLHTCGFLNHKSLKDHILIYRESNIEHQYYRHLGSAERNLLRKPYFYAESMKLKYFQRILRHADIMMAVSADDAAYLEKQFPGQTIYHIPSFHGHDEPDILPGHGDYILYQGKLSVPENYRAVSYILDRIWDKHMPRLVIAGQEPPDWMRRKVNSHHNVQLMPNPTNDEMEQLIRHAHINLILTFQATGLKLKLINALFRGRFCLVNPEMLAGTGLESACQVARTPLEFREQVFRLSNQSFDKQDIDHRRKVLENRYSDRNNCKRLMEVLTLQK